MTIADKLIEERRRHHWTQEELAERLGVSRQAVSKWESGQSVPDLTRVVQLAELFGVSTDYLLKKEVALEPVEAMDEANSPLLVTMPEAEAFLGFRQWSAKRMALAVALCILSPAPLVALAGYSEEAHTFLSEDVAAAVGVVVLLGMIALAVSFFIRYGLMNEGYSYLEHELFETAYGVAEEVSRRKAQQATDYARQIAGGVVLCILSPLPLIVCGAFRAPEWLLCLMVSVLLVLVAVGVFLIIDVSMVRGGYDLLLQQGDYTRSKKRANRKTERIASIYWSVVTAGYLLWSFLSNAWSISWVVWPVAGVLFGAVSALIQIVSKEE